MAAPPFPSPIAAVGVGLAVNSNAALLAGALKPFTKSVKWVISKVR